MLGLSNLVMELSCLGLFKNVESVPHRAISKDHVGEIRVVFNNETIQVPVYTGEDAEAIANKIIKKSAFDSL